jgi:hypothetical protein
MVNTQRPDHTTEAQEPDVEEALVTVRATLNDEDTEGHYSMRN